MNPRKTLLMRASVIVMLFAFAIAPMAYIKASAAAPATTTTKVFLPSADAYVNSTKRASNYGKTLTLRDDGSPDVRSYLRFVVSGTAGQTIKKAVLRIYANTASPYSLVARRVYNNSWGETTITYANKPAVGSIVGASVAVKAGTWVSIDVTPFVKGNGTFSLDVATPGVTAINLASRETGAHSPRLVLILASSATLTPAPTRTPAPAPTQTSAPPPTQTPAPAPSSGSIKHVFDIWFENRSYSAVWGTSSAPYITSLGNTYARSASFYAQFHPSLPDYIAFFGGSNYGITTDCSPSSSCHVNAKHLGDLLEAKGLSWKFYEESMPSPCYLTTSGNYAPKHNPAIYFDDVRNNSTRCKSHDVTYTPLATDLASASTTPNFAFITPNLCNDMHDCSVSTGDTWLKNHLPAILNSPSCTVDKCLVIVTFDEGSGSDQHILTIFAGSGAKLGAVSNTHYTHYSALRTIEYIFGLPTLTSNDANAQPMTDMLR